MTLYFLLACAWFDPQKPQAEILLQAELAPPVNSGKEPEDPGILGYGWRRAAIGRWLAAHPEAELQIVGLEDQLRAHTELTVPEAWEQLQKQSKEPDFSRIELEGSPGRVVIAVDRIEAVAPNRAAWVAEVREKLKGRGIPSLYATTSVRRVHVGALEMDLRALCPEPMAWLLLQEGREPICLPHDAPESMMVDFSDYFGIDLTTGP